MKIVVQNLSKKINGSLVLNDISLCIKGGSVCGLCGINGSGKTMLMRAICGLITPTTGSVSINGQVLDKDMDFPESIGILLENPSFLPNLTGKENLQLLSEMSQGISESDLNTVLSTVGLSISDTRKYRKYSLGMKQRLGIAAVILNNPDILIFDEPLNALDTDGVAMVHKVINEARERQAAVILSCHNKEELDMLADDLIFIENGKIISHEKLR